MTLRIEVNAPDYAVIAVKEQLAMEMERFGDVRVVSVDVTRERGHGQQMAIWERSPNAGARPPPA